MRFVQGRPSRSLIQHAIAFYRVSTERQRRSGLGIEAQPAAVVRFAEAEGFTIAAEFVEAETGKGADALDRRPQLAAALAAGRLKKCPVLVAKLVRLPATWLHRPDRIAINAARC